MKPPVISVLLTSYNHGEYIAEAIQSVLNQSFQDFELIIIDDCSTDQSWNVIKKFQDPRIIAIRNTTNIGMVHNINSGISLAKGKYIAHFNSDDRFILEDKLQKQFDYLENNLNCGAVFTRAKAINPDGSYLPDKDHYYYSIFDKGRNKTRFEWLKSFFTEYNSLCYPSVLVRKKIYEELGCFNAAYTIMLDLNMWIRICSKYDIYVIDEYMVEFRIGAHSQSCRSDLNPIAQYEAQRILENFFFLDDGQKFQEVFGDKIADLNYPKEKEKEIVKFLIIKEAMSLTYAHRKFAMDNLFTIFSNPDNVALIGKVFNFDCKEFLSFKKSILKEGGFHPEPIRIVNDAMNQKMLKIIKDKKSLFYKITHPLWSIRYKVVKRIVKNYE
jgi:glycosyltransferase involved in cell wall biosynthesis